MKKLIITLFVILIVFSSCLSVLDQFLLQTMKDMVKELKFEIVEIKDITLGSKSNPFDFDKIRFTVDVKCKNINNAFAVVLKNIDFDLLVNNQKAATINPQPNKNINNNQEILLPFEVQISLSKLTNLSFESFNKGNINYSIIGNYNIVYKYQNYTFSTEIYGN